MVLEVNKKLIFSLHRSAFFYKILEAVIVIVIFAYICVRCVSDERERERYFHWDGTADVFLIGPSGQSQ